MTEQRIAIIIPTYNRKSKLQVLLNCLKNSTKAKTLELFIVVVVDGSTDGTIEMIEKDFPEVHLLLNQNGNWWFTRGINEGLKFAQSFQPDYCLIINDDIVFSSDYLEILIRSYNEVPSNSIVTSVTLSEEEPNKVLFSGVKNIVRWRFKLIRYHKFLSRYSDHNMKGLHWTLTFPGRGTLIPNFVIKELNYFDESFIQYHSDGDFCLRALKKGYRTYVNWEAKIYTSIKTTNPSTTYLNRSLLNILKSFISPYSRNYIPQKAKFLCRHGVAYLMPLTLMLFITAMLLSVFKKNKINGY